MKNSMKNWEYKVLVFSLISGMLVSNMPFSKIDAESKEVVRQNAKTRAITRPLDTYDVEPSASDIAAMGLSTYQDRNMNFGNNTVYAHDVKYRINVLSTGSVAFASKDFKVTMTREYYKTAVGKMVSEDLPTQTFATWQALNSHEFALKPGKYTIKVVCDFGNGTIPNFDTTGGSPVVIYVHKKLHPTVTRSNVATSTKGDNYFIINYGDIVDSKKLFVTSDASLTPQTEVLNIFNTDIEMNEKGELKLKYDYTPSDLSQTHLRVYYPSSETMYGNYNIMDADKGPREGKIKYVDSQDIPINNLNKQVKLSIVDNAKWDQADKDNPGAYTYAIKSGADVISIDTNGNITPKKLGTAIVTVNLENTLNTNGYEVYKAATKDVTINVTKAPLNIKVGNMTWKVGQSIPTVKPTHGLSDDSQLLPGDTFETLKTGFQYYEPTFSYDSPPISDFMKTPGTHKGVIDVTNKGNFTPGNYDVIWDKGDVEITQDTATEDYVKLTGSGGDPVENKGWFNSDVKVSASDVAKANGYSKLGIGVYETDSVTFSDEVNISRNLTYGFAFRDPKSGAVTTTVDKLIKIDKDKPDIYDVDFNTEKMSRLHQVLANLNIGHFYKNKTNIKVSGEDNGMNGKSGIKEYEVSILKVDKNGDPIVGEVPVIIKSSTGEGIEFSGDNGRYNVAASATDYAGNKKIVDYKWSFVIDDTVPSKVDLAATAGGDAYDGSEWTSNNIIVNVTGGDTGLIGELDHYEYQIGTTGAWLEIPLTNPGNEIFIDKNMNDILNVRAVSKSGVEGVSNSIQIKRDANVPTFTMTMTHKVNGADAPYIEGTETKSPVTFNFDPVTPGANVSKVKYQYRVNGPNKWIDIGAFDMSGIDTFTNDKSMVETYQFQAINEAGVTSTFLAHRHDINSKVTKFNDIKIDAKIGSKDYVQDTWAKGKLDFILTEGILAPESVNGYEYLLLDEGVVADENNPDWLPLKDTNKDRISFKDSREKTIYFRTITEYGDKGPISNGFKIKLDNDAPDFEILTNSGADVTGPYFNGEITARINDKAAMLSPETKEYKIAETVEGLDAAEWKKDLSQLKIADNHKGVIRVKSVDEAGNSTTITTDVLYADSMKPEIMNAKENGSYYLPRPLKFTDNLSGILSKMVSFNSGTETALSNDLVSNKGTYVIKAKDNSLNETTLNFEIKGLPDKLANGHDGLDELAKIKEEMKDIESEYDANTKKDVQDKIDQLEKDYIDANKNFVLSLVDDASKLKIDAINSTTFNDIATLNVTEFRNKLSKTELKDYNDKVNTLIGSTKNKEIKRFYDVKLMENNVEVALNGKIKITIPTANVYAPKVVYYNEVTKEFEEITEITTRKARAGKTTIVFESDHLGKFAVLGQFLNIDVDGNGTPDVNVDVDGNGTPDVNIDVDADNKPDINIDVDGDGKPDINIDVDGDGKPDINIDVDGDGKPDINIDVDGDGKPDINIDLDGDNKPDINIDVNGDGKPDINIDVDGDGKPDINIDLDGDNKPDINIDLDGDNKPDINVDLDGDNKPDINIDLDGDNKPDINIDVDGDNKPDINIDLDGDNKPDINIDLDGDGKPDINIDLDGDNKPDINIDLDGDNKPDINIDLDGDNKPDINVDLDGDNKPDINIDLNGDNKPDINIDVNGDNKADVNIDVDGDMIPDVNISSSNNNLPDVNIDINGDNIPDINIDTNGTGIWTPSKDNKNDDKIILPDTKIDTNGDGIGDTNIKRPAFDHNHDGIDDNWKPTIKVDYNKDGIIDYMTGPNPNVNVDIDGDGKADINIDTNGDGVADKNIDKNGNGKLDKDEMVNTSDQSGTLYFLFTLLVSGLALFKTKKKKSKE